MSLSLSSLLNPSPDAETHPASPPPPRRESLQRQYNPPFNGPPTTAQDAAHALAALSASPPPLQTTQWQGYSTQEQRPPQYSQPDWRPASGYGDPATAQLPPPSSHSPVDTRKMSSPSLEQYRVASRSPEQQRASIVHHPNPGFTLPPLQGLGPPSPETRQQPTFDQAFQASEEPGVDLQASTVAPSDPPHRADDIRFSSHREQVPSHSPVDEAPPAAAPQENGNAISRVESSPQDEIQTPAIIKQEGTATPQLSGDHAAPEADPSTLKAVASLKNEHGLRTHSPLRDSSIPLPSTENHMPEQIEPISKKRPAPAKTKKGTATTMKKAPPAKKRKVEPKRDTTPSSRTSKAPTAKGTSVKGTPVNSSPAPSARSPSADPTEEPYDEDDDEEMTEDIDGNLYCICRKPDNGTFMIGCDGSCDDWFHGKCVGIEERDKNLIEKYMCPNCTKANVGRTSWKRICRRHNCRQPARVNRSKTGMPSSKYCSDECGLQFFRDMIGKSRGREDTARNRSSKRTASVASSERTAPDDDLGARGGVISAGELKTLLQSSKNIEDFKRMGESALSSPETPNGEEDEEQKPKYTEAERLALERIQKFKQKARHRHAMLKDRLKFVDMVKHAANRTATEKELKPKDYCGYDSRIEWTEDEFENWRSSKAGQQALEQNTLTIDSTTTEEHDADKMDVDPEHTVCDTSGKKKCSRHMEWAKLAVDDLRMAVSENSDGMRAADSEEKEIQERAAMRGKAKAGTFQGEGAVEVYDLEAATESNEEKMDEDVKVAAEAETPAVLETVESGDATPAAT